MQSKTSVSTDSPDQLDEVEVLLPPDFVEAKVSFRLMDLSNDYLQAAQLLCKAILTKKFDQGYGGALIVMNVARQSLELYFKAALAFAAVSVPKTHRLTKLSCLYEKLYPEHPIECPFELHAEPNLPLFNDISDPSEEFDKTLDQRVRYPTDHQDNIFTGNKPFDPAAFCEALVEMQISMSPLFVKICWL